MICSAAGSPRSARSTCPPQAGRLAERGFELLPTAQRPHFTDEARDPGQITPGVLVVAGDEEAAAVCQVVDLVPAGDGTVVHLRLDAHLDLCDQQVPVPALT